jgi:hypothetical protein
MNPFSECSFIHTDLVYTITQVGLPKEMWTSWGSIEVNRLYINVYKKLL